MKRSHAGARARLEELAAGYDLLPGSADRLSTLLALVEAEPAAITSVRDPDRAVDVHVADSLVALDLEAVRPARLIADLGSGGGFPGLVLAIARPQAHVSLVESAGRKCRFLARAVDELGLGNVTVVQARAEAWPEGLGAQDLVTARALAPLGVIVEYAAPLLSIGGALVAWKAGLEPGEEADAAAAAQLLGLAPPRRREVQPFPDARDRALYVSSKVRASPPNYPRRPGMARKRPIRASS